ncbi:hypothetical protein K505DRAFT_199064, partial [Melanomma pulvis-pyrius CBS 109.77]
KCVNCLEDVPSSKGGLGCDRHFLCNDCATETFRRALGNILEFPARCCPDNELPQLALERLFASDPDFIKKYLEKLAEHRTPHNLRLYCCNPYCSTFIPPQHHLNTSYSTCTKLGCETRTCVSCKNEWVEGHDCVADSQTTMLPESVPKYSDDFRIKLCPNCKVLTQHAGNCNRMTCPCCLHSYCFICLDPLGDCADDACPMYDDPKYDKDGYELTERAIHRDTGRNREG